MSTRIISNIISKSPTDEQVENIITKLQNIIHQIYFEISPYNNTQSIKSISDINDVISDINNMKPTISYKLIA